MVTEQDGAAGVATGFTGVTQLPAPVTDAAGSWVTPVNPVATPAAPYCCSVTMGRHSWGIAGVYPFVADAGVQLVESEGSPPAAASWRAAAG